MKIWVVMPVLHCAKICRLLKGEQKRAHPTPHKQKEEEGWRCKGLMARLAWIQVSQHNVKKGCSTNLSKDDIQNLKLAKRWCCWKTWLNVTVCMTKLTSLTWWWTLSPTQLSPKQVWATSFEVHLLRKETCAWSECSFTVCPWISSSNLFRTPKMVERTVPATNTLDTPVKEPKRKENVKNWWGCANLL